MATKISEKSFAILEAWLASCTRNNNISRNTVAIGIVVLDHLIKNSPIARNDVVSQGGEISGARSTLGKILELYNLPATYLREATTRQAHQDGQRLFEAFNWGLLFSELESREREKILRSLIERLRTVALKWLERQNLKLPINRSQSPAKWINIILENARGRSGGVVEQHLVGAKLARRFHSKNIPNHPAHAADIQTERSGDFPIENVIYHVTSAPSRSVLQKCRQNLIAGLYPILLIPRSQDNRTRILAQDEGIDENLTIIAIEDFIAINIIELSAQENKDFFSVLQEIIALYNSRLREVETDLSLQIEIR